MKEKIIFILTLIVIFSTFVYATKNSMTILEEYTNGNKYTVELEIQEGWNIVTGLYDVRNIDDNSEIKKDDIEVIWYYSSVQNKYIQVYPNMDEDEFAEDISFHESDDAILNSAKWIYSTKSGSLKYSTSRYNKLNERKLASGWNFVGITPDMYKGTLDEAGHEDEYFSWSSIEGTCDIEKVYFWMYPEQEWDEFSSFKTSKMKEYDFDDFLGNGMIVKVTKDCHLNEPISEISQPPSLPNENKNQNSILIEQNIDNQEYKQSYNREDSKSGIDFIRHEASYYLGNGEYYTDAIVNVFESQEDSNKYWHFSFENPDPKIFMKENINGMDVLKSVENNTIFQNWQTVNTWRYKNYVIVINEPKTEGDIFKAYLKKYS